MNPRGTKVSQEAAERIQKGSQKGNPRDLKANQNGAKDEILTVTILIMFFWCSNYVSMSVEFGIPLVPFGHLCWCP